MTAASPTCKCPSTDAFSKRSARSGVVLHETATGGIVILTAAKAPKVWRVLVAAAMGWRFGTFNMDNADNYHIATDDTTINLSDPDELVRPDDVDEDKFEQAKALAVERYRLNAGLGELKTTTGYVPRAKKAATSEEFNAQAPNPDRYWYESDHDSRLFTDFVKMRLAGHDTNLMVVGPSGFGKTEGVIRLGERLNIPVHIVNCQVITTPEKWLGQMHADPERGTYFDVSQHLQWVERSHSDCEGAEFCILLYDEITRLRPELGNMMFSLLDGQQGLEVPQMGRRVEMSRQNIIIATANIGSAYAGTFTMDWALRGRFDMTLERPFPPTEEEVKIITTASPGLEEQEAQDMVRVAEHTRILWKNGELESPISTRLLLSWARLVAGGYTIKDAAEYTIIPVYAEDGGADSDRAKVKMAIDGKVNA